MSDEKPEFKIEPGSGAIKGIFISSVEVDEPKTLCGGDLIGATYTFNENGITEVRIYPLNNIGILVAEMYRVHRPVLDSVGSYSNIHFAIKWANGVRIFELSFEGDRGRISTYVPLQSIIDLMNDEVEKFARDMMMEIYQIPMGVTRPKEVEGWIKGKPKTE